ncbi:MAG: amylo-alpha-1,6-glucosidase [Bacteroidota bacterium]|nr:glycogen debranching protein [Ignavibacteria bacterium]MCU7500650.1 glycogen debranching protein [Ignavibacteria bacterium]MCU7512775.1 glycogen debranching protein [Ignavibacteria bacterium]MCU7520343.1 glycogen debranching protein [Ignavibacteria bacterium]MCU7523946.1 glycogen debranching protein [Ignavibacteria bacterium]
MRLLYRPLLSSFIILFLFTSVPAQRQLYKSDTYSVYSDRVVQNGFTALAKTRNELISDYKSSFRKKTQRTVVMKFSINGPDNERAPGQDHHFILIPGVRKDTAYFSFGKPDTGITHDKLEKRSKIDPLNPYLDEDKDLVIRLDMREVLSDFKKKGYFETYDKAKLPAESFKAVYVAGANEPLNWNFPALPDHPEMSLKDPDGDGIYEVTIHFPKEYSSEEKSAVKSWKLSKDISRFPSYESPDILIDALYNKAMEEMLEDVREDGAFMAGAQWTGVWTRDISYSILLSMAIVNPDASKTSLMAKVKNGIIIQDTGTGGAWPVSSDRMTWALAAWEVYKTTGDKQWLKTSFEIIKKSAGADLENVLDTSTGLFMGESSFLDWREQTYPRWMDPKDIYKSKNLGTNMVHYETYRILSEMAKLLGEATEKYDSTAAGIKDGINRYLWMEDKGYYGQYLYGRNYLSLSPKSEALGEALSVIFDGAGTPQRQKKIIQNVPVTPFGLPCIYPEIPDMPPYHNNSVWPFVESFWAWASAKTGNNQSVLGAMASVYRPAALFLTNKENLVAQTGDFLGTEINSDRQLWSLSGNLALTYRVIYGMRFTADSLVFMPFIPKEYEGQRTLKNLKYRSAALEVSVEGYGNKIASVRLDGRPYSEAAIPASLSGSHRLEIFMNNSLPEGGKVNMQDVAFAPEIPAVKYEDTKLSWNRTGGAIRYVVCKNGSEAFNTDKTEFEVKPNDPYMEYQVKAVDKNGLESFLSAPVTITISPEGEIYTFQAEESQAVDNTADREGSKYSGFTGTGYLVLDKSKNREVSFEVDLPEAGLYSIDFRYANGNGPINTENKCAIRTLVVDGRTMGAVVMPQRGDNLWTDWGFTNSLKAELSKGRHILTLKFSEYDDNMNVDVNGALLDSMRLILLK